MTYHCAITPSDFNSTPKKWINEIKTENNNEPQHREIISSNYLEAQKNCGQNNNITVFDWGKRTQIGSELGFYFIHLNEKEGSGSVLHHNESNDLKNIILIDIVPCMLDPSCKWDISNNINMHISLKYKTKKHRIQRSY